MESPLVSIICLCYNHQPYVSEALASACLQTYDNIEVIIVDDCSKDGSAETIAQLVQTYPEVRFIRNSVNRGNCASFNKAFELSNGRFIIDLAADDVLLPERVATGVAELTALPPDFGVHYCDHEWIGPTGKSLGFQYARDDQGRLIDPPPSGDIYVEVLEKYFISAPTMMIRREVLEDLGGYDASLSYEDFDFWVRSARKWGYHFSDKVLVKKRVLSGSLSSSQFRFGSVHDRSTYQVCAKALKLNVNQAEHHALKNRLVYERKHALASGNLRLAWDYHLLIRQVNALIHTD